MICTRAPYRRASMVLVVACLLAIAGPLTVGGRSALAAQPHCQTVRGHFFPSQIEIDNNPKTLEFMGPVTGALAGTFLSTELVLSPGRPETPTVLLFTGSCTSSLRLIPAVGKPGKIPSFQHLYEGVLPWFPISFSTSWCSSPLCGCASCSSGCGQATVLLLT